MKPELKQYVAMVDKTNGVLHAFYEHSQFIGAFQVAFLERLDGTVPEGASIRKAIRALRALKRSDSHQAILVRALKLLDVHGRVVPPEEAKQGELIAVLPLAGS